MFSLSALILTAAVALIAGLVIGALSVKALNPQQQQNRDLEKRLQKAEQKLSDYQQEVTKHFAQTSELVNDLTQRYKDVHQHLADSALQLTNPEISRQLIEAGDGKLISNTAAAPHQEEELPHAPRDWAPKAPGEEGQLSESFGLKKGDNEETDTKIAS